MIDYKKIKIGIEGVNLIISTSFEELFASQDVEIFSIYSIFKYIIERFAEPKFSDINRLEAIFNEFSLNSDFMKRYEIALGRLINHREIPDYKACQGESIIRSPAFNIRFDDLIRADKTAENSQ